MTATAASTARITPEPARLLFPGSVDARWGAVFDSDNFWAALVALAVVVVLARAGAADMLKTAAVAINSLMARMVTPLTMDWQSTGLTAGLPSQLAMAELRVQSGAADLALSSQRNEVAWSGLLAAWRIDGILLSGEAVNPSSRLTHSAAPPMPVGSASKRTATPRFPHPPHRRSASMPPRAPSSRSASAPW